jgi:hypothetical protein
MVNYIERQSGGTLGYETLAKAGDLKIDVSFDLYPPDQPQTEDRVASDRLWPG